ncbi:uncharacterized protein LOC110989301 [Acanthaster planci]|uniref:Uncharacterized protein LOC110989301 n=1 Tax=Acanthaster planci TaxID=133434 RepID=A0A8B7ZV39_ACAPL|nr:uncharacterized protein LOC110989301 [Acanthaster planci]
MPTKISCTETCKMPSVHRNRIPVSKFRLNRSISKTNNFTQSHFRMQFWLTVKFIFSLLLFLVLVCGAVLQAYNRPLYLKVTSPKQGGFLRYVHHDDSRKGNSLTATKGHTLTLTLRMAAVPRLIQRLYCDFLRSAVLFWSPKLGHISVILDKESTADHRLAARLSQQEPAFGVKFDFVYEPLPSDPSVLKSRGYLRQLWSSFFMDLYINASIIAWIDTDGMFTTPVTTENIFNDHRLRVVTFTNWVIPRRHGWDKTTELAMGKKLVADFMTYFPACIWRDTITNCRNHILTHMKLSNFEDAFRRLVALVGGSLSPVNIFLNYAYYFEHDRYDWHIDVNRNLEAYNTQHLQPGFEVKPNETVPEIHVTIHAGRHFNKSPDPLLQGYCIAKRYVGAPLAGCKRFENTTNIQLFDFLKEKRATQNHFQTWCKGSTGLKDCSQRIEAHYQTVRKYYNSGWYDLDLRRVSVVERAAELENVTCPEVFDWKGTHSIGFNVYP